MPTDLSDCANAALPVAIMVAKDHDAELIFVHVADFGFQYAGYGVSPESQNCSRPSRQKAHSPQVAM